jgi:AcrR family transcriptional regulator
MNIVTRKKEPERVRRSLLDCAARLSADKGITGVTIQAIADAAGVTKGGLFHHFPNKQALIEAMFEDMLAFLDCKIEASLAHDNNSFGCFTRAYVDNVFACEEICEGNPWAEALPVSVLTEPELTLRWETWLAGRMQRHVATDSHPLLEVIRRAADGVWFNTLLARKKRIDQPELKAYLMRLTYQDAESISNESVNNEDIKR